jgi:hypothetical protein
MKDKTASPRVLFLGDSSTFGVYVQADEAFPAQTEACLRQNGWPRPSPSNWCARYNLFHVQLRLDEFAPFNPGVVLMSGYHWKAIAKYKAQFRGSNFSPGAQAFGICCSMRKHTASPFDFPFHHLFVANIMGR